jgi:outer membrane lipoprotein-sorting protein
MKTLKISALLFSLLLLANVASFAQEITGLKIIQNVYDRPTGEDMKSELKMILVNSSGGERVREIIQYSRDFGEVEKSIMFFAAPADVKNTSFMNWSYDEDDKDDDQWIYLPALKKTKRISSDSKSDYFMGSDFTYDDLGDRKPSQDTHKILREETIDGKDCYVVESTPKDEDYMYSKTVTWIIKDEWVGVKKDFYDEDGDLLKTLTIKKVEEIEGFLVVTHSVMENIQKEHKTIIKLSDVKINTGISKSKFTERMMTRGI